MADLKVIPRQILTQPMDLGGSNEFSRLQNTLNQVSDFAAGQATDMFVDIAKKRGEAKALNNQGVPQKSAPSITRATAAENEAYLSATSKLLTVKLNGLLSENTKYVNNNLQKLGPKALQKLNSLNNATMEGFSQQIPDEIKNDLQYQFILGKEKSMAFMMDEVSKFNDARAAESFSTTFNSNLNDVKEKIFSGDQNGAYEANEAAKKTIQDYKTLGKLSPLQESDYMRQLAFAISDSVAVSEFLKARAKGPAAEAEYLFKAANDMPTGISREQWISGQTAIGKEITRLGKLGNEHIAYVKSEIENGIASGRIANENDLMAYQDKVTASDYMDYRTKMLNKDAANNKSQKDIDQYNLLSETDPSKATLTSDNIKDAAFEQKLEPLLQDKINETGDPNAKLSIRDMVSVAKQEPGPNRYFNTKLQYAIKSQNPALSRDAILAYKDLRGTPGQANRSRVLDIDAQSDRIAYMALNLADNANEPLDNAILKAQKAIMLTTDSQRVANMNAYKDKFVTGKKGVLNFKKSFLNASGVNAEDNPFASKIYNDILMANSENMPDINDAENLSNIQFAQGFSKSEFNIDPKRVMQNAPELVVPKANQGRWLRNQEILNLYGVVKELEGAPIAKANREKNFKRLNEIILKTTTEPLMDISREKLNKEAEYLNRQLVLADYEGPAIKWNMGKLKDKYTEQELMNSDLFLEASREMLSKHNRGVLSEEGAVGITLAGLFSGNTRTSRRPTISVGGISSSVYLDSSSETMARSDGRKIYDIKYTNGIGAPIALANPFNKSDNPGVNGNAQFLVKEWNEFLPKTSAKMTSLSMAQIDEKTQNALFVSENPLSFTGMMFDKKNTIAERFAKKAAFKKKAKETKEAEEAKAKEIK